MEQFLSAKFLSGRNANLKAGILGVTTNTKVIEAVGRVGIGSTIFEPTADLDVRGSANIGTVQISSAGIVTATRYFGDGSQLTGVTGTQIVTQDPISTPVFLTFANNTGVTSLGVVTTGSNVLSYIPSSGNLGIGTTNPTSKLDVRGNVLVSGVSTFIGAITGTISTATKLQNSRTFEITGDIVASPISFNGTGNVSLAATIQPNSVGLGTDTFGDYVKDISGTANQITVTGGTGEGSTPTLSIPNQFTAPQDVLIIRDLQVNRNLNVNGNITIGGTSATIFSQSLTISDSDIVLGYRTDAFGNDISNDNTASHGGVAVASTEGNPLVQLFIAGIETNPSTYKKIMWFKAGEFSGLGTDAWLFNYAVGIGSTQFPSGTRLAAGSVQFTENDLAVVRNINASGVVTALSFRGDGSQLTGVTGTQIVTQDPISTPVFLTFANNTGVTSLGVVTTGSNVLSYIPSSGNLGIGTTNPTSKLTVVGDVLVSGISTLGTVKISSGIVTASSGIVTYYGDGSNLQGIISTAGISVLDEGSQVGTSVTTLNFTGAIISVSNAVNGISTVTVTESGVANYASVAGIATYASIAGIATYASIAGIATYASIAGVATYASNAGVATYASIAGIATYASNAGISTNVIGGIASVTQLSVSGISTLGTVQISSGIITATSGVVTYYGDGSKLTDILASSIVGVSSFATNAGIATNLKGGLVGNVPYQSATDTTVFLTNGSSGTILQSNGVGNAPSWVSAAPAGAITGLTIRDEGTIVGSANSVSELNFVGAIVSATSTAGIATITFVDYVSNAGVATALQNSRTFEITGDIVASPISFNGTGNVSLAATIQPNSVGLGTDTFGDYVKDISGTANQITVTGGTGEGSTPTLSIPNQFTAPQDVLIIRDLQVNRNLNVNGNITIGGTSATIFSQSLTISDPDIILGYRTDAFGNDISNDNTANHGGVAVASTEGNPLVQLFIAGIETNPATYKKIMWFKAGEFAGLGTDAWLMNYAVGIGSTQFPSGTRLAAGSVQFTENDLAVVRNINASGVVTALSFSGNASSATFATTAGIATFATTAGIATFATNAGISTFATTAGISTFATTAGIATFATNAGIATFATTAGVSISVIGGIGSITQLQVTGVSTFTNGPVLIGSGTSTGTASQPLQVSGGAYVSGNLGVGNTNPQRKLHLRAQGADGIFLDNTDQTGNFTGPLLRVRGQRVDSNASQSFSGQLVLEKWRMDASINSGQNLGAIIFGGNYDTLPGITTGMSYGASIGAIAEGAFSNINTAPTAIVFNTGTVGLGTLASANVTYGTEAARITSNRNLLIGSITETGTASQRLQVTGGAYVSGNIGIGTTNPTSKLTVVGDVLVVGVVTATDFNSASDAKLKTNIQPIADPLEKVTQIQGVSFNWIKDNKPSMGVIADELQKVLPELVSDTDPKTVNYNGLIGLLIEVVKEQQEKIQSLEQRITRLE